MDYRIEPSQGDGWKITTPHGYIDYRHRPEDGLNEIWWVESHKRGHGSELVNLMQKHHPAETIAWGATSEAGRGLMEKWHAAHPEVAKDASGAFEGQFDPFSHDDDYENDDDLDDDLDDDDVADYAAAYSHVVKYAADPPTDSALQYLLKQLHYSQDDREGDSSADHTKRGVIADKLQDLGRDHEAALLRDGHPVKITDTKTEGYGLVPGEVEPNYPSHAWPGGGPILYYLEGRNGGTFCSKCMNEAAKNRADILAGKESLDEDDSLDDYVIHPKKYKPFVHEEGPPEVCDGCSRRIPAMYGDPDRPEDDDLEEDP